MIVAVYGSPRSGGNTDILMDSFLSALETEEKIMHFKLRDMNLQPCMSAAGVMKPEYAYIKTIYKVYMNALKMQRTYFGLTNIFCLCYSPDENIY